MTYINKSTIVKLNSLGLKLRELRKAKGSFLRQVATFLELDTAIISKYESGNKRPSEEQVIKLANYYNIDKKELLKLWLCDIVLDAVSGKSQALEALELALQTLQKKQYEKL